MNARHRAFFTSSILISACVTDFDGEMPYDPGEVEDVASAEGALTINLGSSLASPVISGDTCGLADELTPTCGSVGAPDQAFLWTSPDTGEFRFSTEGSSYDTLLQILNPATGESLGCNDDASGTLLSSLAVSLSANQQVRVVVDGYSSLCGTFNLNITSRPGACGATMNAWTSASSMASSRSWHTSTLLGSGKVLVAGGYILGATSWEPTATAELYDPVSESWSAAPSMPMPRRAHTATLLDDGRVLVTGGYTGSGYTASTAIYDPGTNTWSSGPRMSTLRYEHTATLLNDGKVLVAGGFTGSPVTVSAEVYDPSTNTWASAGSMSAARAEHTATLLGNGKVLIAGGYNGRLPVHASADIYDPVTNSWSSAGSMSGARLLHTATWLPNLGKVVVAGGNNGGAVLATSELYDPAANTWSPAASLTTARYVHAAVLFGPCGKVLVSGAYGRSNAEIYDPMTNRWSSAGTMSTTRGEHTATWLPSVGKVLVVGGIGQTVSGERNTTLNTTELYTP
ncbi:Kelch repeat-containing protein [Sorangium sp. So ce1153]|uniref:Kelch repeat-containing protein n=1 Tax=Sorangium sp. So ce1153 TaxID=3133333 RepID=UPI003F63E8DB